LEYFLHILILVGIYSILAVSLDLLVGHTGLLSIAHAAFYGLGAYTSALLAVQLNTPFLLALLLGIAVGALFSLIVSLPSLRLYDDYFVIATFAVQVILFNVFNNWMELTRGPLGIPGIPQPTVFGLTIESHAGFFILAASLSALAHLVVRKITTSPFGRVLRAIREDEVFAQSLGKNTLHFKVIVFAISAALAASAGCLFAYYIRYVDPTSFTVMESILVISMVIIGGAGSPWGPLIGALFLVSLPEALRFLGFPSPVAANLRQMLYGVLLVIMMMVRPRGLVGRYGFSR
jgi:branched-chain amino acid transport system permease protein